MAVMDTEPYSTKIKNKIEKKKDTRIINNTEEREKLLENFQAKNMSQLTCDTFFKRIVDLIKQYKKMSFLLQISFVLVNICYLIPLIAVFI